MNALTWVHIAGGSIAILTGVIAASARKGGPLHAQAGTWFAASMLLMGITASVLAYSTKDAGLGIGGILTCYFIATSWMTARQRDGRTGTFEIAACVFALSAAVVIVVLNALDAVPPTPAGRGPSFFFAFIALIAGLLDLKAVRRGVLSAAQRVTRHLWRMCYAFFIATGAFFIGQQDVMPESIQGAPILFVLGFAPLGLMLFWLARVRYLRKNHSAMKLTPAAVLK